MTYNFSQFFKALERLDAARKHLLLDAKGGNPSIASMRRLRLLDAAILKVDALIRFYELDATQDYRVN